MLEIRTVDEASDKLVVNLNMVKYLMKLCQMCFITIFVILSCHKVVREVKIHITFFAQNPTFACCHFPLSMDIFFFWGGGGG